MGLWVFFAFDKSASPASGAKNESRASAIRSLTDLFLRIGEPSCQESSQYLWLNADAVSHHNAVTVPMTNAHGNGFAASEPMAPSQMV